MQESIGDSIFLGFMTPQHLNRLRLLPDQFLFSGQKNTKASSSKKDENQPKTKSTCEYANVTALGKPYPKISCKNREASKTKNDQDPYINDFDLTLLLKMALTKIPQVPFEYILDIFRWDLFSGNVSMNSANLHFWKLAMKEQGIHPPDWENRRNFFDPGAKYHVADNTPFVR